MIILKVYTAFVDLCFRYVIMIPWPTELPDQGIMIFQLAV